MIGQALRDAREVKTVSLRRAAVELGVSPSYLSKVERGEELPSERFVLEACRYYGLNEDVMLAMMGRVSARLQSIIIKHPILFATLLTQLESVPPDAILRVVRSVSDGDW